MKKVFFSFFLLLSFSYLNQTFAQYQMRGYNTMIGFRAGTSFGGTIKRFITDHDAIEAMAFNRWKGWNYTLLYVHHMDVREFRGMEWYLGGGGHYGIWNEPKAEPPWVYKGTTDYRAYGVDFIAGLEYNFYNTNVYLSFDWKPAYNFVDFTKLWWDEAAFTLKYSF
ncbi:MAG: hypothetical protein KGZ90_14090 [Algoriphagus sp.]|nr:hypothetical protein [Algoriphagus sp.]